LKIEEHGGRLGLSDLFWRYFTSSLHYELFWINFIKSGFVFL